MSRTAERLLIATAGGIAISLVFALSASIASVASAATLERSKLKGSLDNTGIEPAAEGQIRMDLRASKSKLDIRLKGLDPSISYELRVDGLLEATITPKSSGRAKIRFRTPLRGSSSELLDFDPRGKSITVDDGLDGILAASLSGPGEPDDVLVDERTQLARTSLAVGAKAKARFKIKRDGRRTFKVEIEDMPQDGEYELRIDGLVVATISVAAGSGKVEFDSQPSPPKLLLDFDPRGAMIDITQGTAVFFSDVLEAEADGVNVCSEEEMEVFLVTTPAAGEGKAKARLRTRDDCDVDLRVEIEDVPEGDYDVCVAGILRGAITAVDNGFEVEGEIEFDTTPDPDEILLDFDVDFAQLEIRHADPLAQPGDACPSTTLLFDGSEGGDPGPGMCASEETAVLLGATPAAGGGKADARLRTREDCDVDLRVQIEDVTEGDYDVCVAGILRGTITATDNGSEVEGQIEFDTDPDPDEIPLDFLPVDLAEIEILEADPFAQPGDACPSTTLLFTGGGAGGPGPEVCELVEIEVPLLNVGPDPDAKGDARFRSDTDCDRDFRVEIEDLPAGDYDLLVGGEFQGTITVAFNPEQNEFEGQIEFDNDPDQAGELPFPPDLEPRGQEIEIVQGATLFLSRTLPE